MRKPPGGQASIDGRHEQVRRALPAGPFRHDNVPQGPVAFRTHTPGSPNVHPPLIPDLWRRAATRPPRAGRPTRRRPSSTASPRPMSEKRAVEPGIGAVEARIAARQHGIVTRTQLRAAGFGDDVIDGRIRTRRLTRIHRGVYLVGIVPPRYARELAACLACGPRAVLSHRSAAALWQIVKRRARPASVEVTIPEGRRRRPGLRVYRVGTLRPDEVTRLNGVPITTPARTLYDLADRMSRRRLERAVAEAIALRLTTAAELRMMASRQAGRRGVRRLRAVLDLGGPVRTRSEAEEIFLDLVLRHGVVRPVVNTRVAGHEVDFYWPASRLAVEVDGFACHTSPRAFERDRRRDAELAALGVRVVRVTWRQITEEPDAVLLRLKGTLTVAIARRPEVAEP